MSESSCPGHVEKVYNAKVTISRELDVIRDRLGRPLAPETVDRHDPVMRRVLALEHVTRQRAAGRCSGIDPTVYVEIVDEHLTPLPVEREWTRRRSIPSSARRHALDLERDQDHSRPDALAPVAELLARRAAAERAAAAYAAWARLNDVGLAGGGEDGDIVTSTLADDLDPDAAA
jgi:hypothetical protein